MLATITIASQQQSFVGVWLGSTAGMVLADGLAIIIGKVMGKRLPERAVKYDLCGATRLLSLVLRVRRRTEVFDEN